MKKYTLHTHFHRLFSKNKY